MARKGIPNKKSAAAKDKTKEFFARMLTDAAEKETWDRFLGSTTEEVALKAFLRAVEYKRGKPIQPTEVSGMAGESIRVVVEHIGLTNTSPAQAD